MSSDTPRTDAKGMLPMEISLVALPLRQSEALSRLCDFWVDHARTLERELTAAKATIASLNSELLEQARLLGMSGSREADLVGKVERLEGEIAACKSDAGTRSA